jgi:sugar lactone lactonase YvrE
MYSSHGRKSRTSSPWHTALSFISQRASRLAALTAVVAAAACLPAHAQVPAVVASSALSLTVPGVASTGQTAVDKCGNVYVSSYGTLTEYPAGTGTPTVISPNTLGYGGPTDAIAIDSTKTFLFFPPAGQTYSSAFGYINVSTCKPSGVTVFPSISNANIFPGNHYYFGTAAAITTDPLGDVYFVPTANSSNYIAEFACGATQGVACTAGTLPTGTNVTIIGPLPSNPVSIAADSKGDVFYTDGSANVYEVSPPYSATTAPVPVKVGTGFSHPQGVTFDAKGDLFIADGVTYATQQYYAYTFNSVLYEIPYETTSSTSGLNPAHQFVVANQNLGFGAAPGLDAQGNVYYTTYPGYNQPNLEEILVGTGRAPSAAVGSSSTASINYAFNTAVKLGTPSVSTGTAASTVFTSAGGTCTANGSFAVASGCYSNINFAPSTPGNPAGAVLLPYTIVSSSTAGSANVDIYGTGLGAAATVDQGTLSTLSSTLKTPEGTAVDFQGNVYVADASANTITEFAGGGTTGTAIPVNVATPTGVTPTLPANLSSPNGVAVDATGNLYIADTGNNRIVEVPIVSGALSGSAATVLGVTVKAPTGVTVDAAGNLYIADTGDGKIIYIPNISDTLQTSLAQTFNAGLQAPSAIAVAPNGNVFVADSTEGVVVEFAAPLAANIEFEVVASLSAPSGLATDASGSLYTVDKGNGAIYRYPYTNGALGTRSFISDGLAAPFGVATDAAGNLYATDSVNGLLVKFNRVQPTLPFGDWLVGTASGPMTTYISNSGNQSLIFPTPSYTASGATTAGFAVTADGCAGSTVTTGSGCTLTSTFTPSAPVTNATETLTLAGNQKNGTVGVNLTGTGTTIKPTTLSVAVTNPAAGTAITAGVPVTVKATINTNGATAAPAGNVEFFVNGVSYGYMNVANGVASGTFPGGLPAGSSVVITAVYSGDTVNYSGSQASVTVSVTPSPDTLTLTVLTATFNSPLAANDNVTNPTGPSVQLTAGLTFAAQVIAGGSVTFYSGTTPLGTAAITPQAGGVFSASITTTALRAATTTTVENNSLTSTYALTAKYTGDANLAPATSNAVPIIIVAPPVKQPACATATPATCITNTTGAYFTITPATSTVSIYGSGVQNPPSSASFPLTVTSYGGWTGILNFTCSGLPAYTTCNPFPGTPLVLDSTNSATVTPTTIQFFIKADVPPVTPTASGGFYAWIAGLTGLALLVVRRRLRGSSLARLSLFAGMALVLIASAVGVTGCTSGYNAVHVVTPPGTYNVTIQVSAAQSVVGSTNSSVQLPDTNTPTLNLTLTVQ